ncbi:flavin reductase family protein [Alteromonas pelagimontana]|uniref:Flavin reductase family protein n=1 Tax=Alteromonas pelagimontana TaxID=1858656 RepID=A0A6M4MBW7_9ALTE|nr:flavin reductase family protein [Alteromonas pelagimontana]QJR80692.1 flavin reductase family protein [Alteromonas pelagimontana]
MQSNYHFYEPVLGHRLAHDPFNAIIAPRPIGWISSKGRDGNTNLAPYSFFNAFNYTPPIIGFSSVGYKDSVRNIEQTGEFCWNLVTRPLAEQMNQTSAMVEMHVDEFELAGLEKTPSKKISVPHVAQSPVVMECKKTQIIQLADKRGHPCNSWLVLGEVVGVHIREDLLTDGIFQTTVAQPVLRGGGAGDYFTVSEENRFEMMRP